MGRPTWLYIILQYFRADNPMTWPLLRAPRSQFAESYKTFDQNLGFEPQNILWGGFHAQQAPNTIIMTRPESLCLCSDLGTEPLQLFPYCSEVRGTLFYSLLDLLHSYFWIIWIWIVSFLWYPLLVLVFIVPLPFLAPRGAKTMLRQVSQRVGPPM